MTLAKYPSKVSTFGKPLQVKYFTLIVFERGTNPTKPGTLKHPSQSSSYSFEASIISLLYHYIQR